jgi:hypothetical protein
MLKVTIILAVENAQKLVLVNVVSIALAYVTLLVDQHVQVVVGVYAISL